MFRYSKGEGKETWRLIENSEKGINAAIENGAMFTTVLSIDNDVDHLDDANKVNYKGPLYFDIDNDKDENESLLDCRRLLLKLYSQFGVNLNNVIVHCSGSKGFHILVPAKVFGTNKASAVLPYTYKNMATSFDLLNLDYGIYSGGKGRMWRIENLKRESGRYKVRLTAAQVFRLTMLEIQALTYKAGLETPFDINKHVEYSAELAALFKRSEFKPQKLVTVEDSKFRALEGNPGCITKLLKLEDVQEGRRFNHLVMLACAYAKGKGWRLADLEAETEFLIAHGKSSVYTTERTRLTHLRSIFNYVMASPEYKFSCAVMRKTVVCEVECCAVCPIKKEVEQTEYDPTLGIEVSHNCYFRKTETGRSQITTFVIKPTSVIEFIDARECREYTINTVLIADNNHSSEVVFTQPDWGSKSALIKKLPHPDFAYLGGDTDVQRIFKVVSQIQVPKKTGVKVIGLHKIAGSWHFVCSDGSLGAGGEINELLLETDYYLPTGLINEVIPTFYEAKSLLDKLFTFNANEITVPLVGWFVASIYKERIFEITHQFPLLFIFGAAGAGKTQTILNMKRLFCLGVDNIKSIADVTNFTLIKSANANNTIPLMLDEYKASTFNHFQVKMVSKLIRAAYNNEVGERGTASQEIKTYFYRAPIILAGEQTVTEPAARDRIIEVHMNKDLSAPHLKDFKLLQDLPLGKLGKALLTDALSITDEELKERLEACQTAVPESYSDRPRLNQAIVGLGIDLLKKLAKNYGLEEAVNNAWSQYTTKRNVTVLEEYAESRKTDVDRILEAIATMADIDDRYALSKNYEFKLDEAEAVLFINLRVAHSRFLKFAEEYKSEAEAMNYTSFAKLIKKEPYFMKDQVPVKLQGGVKLCTALHVKRLLEKNICLTGILENPTDTDSVSLQL